ncbi:MAG: ubiquitin C-terminal hydrolase Ubp14 [Paramarteilia canceri]
MGYSKLSIINALKRNDNSIEKALEFLLQNNDSSHATEEPKNNLPPKSFNSNKLSAEHFKIKLENNSSNLFHIKAFVVHKGRSINFGHYIAYIKQTDPSTGLDAWFEFNDEKVKLLQSNPPFAEAYLVFLEQAKN